MQATGQAGRHLELEVLPLHAALLRLSSHLLSRSRGLLGEGGMPGGGEEHVS